MRINELKAILAVKKIESTTMATPINQSFVSIGELLLRVQGTPDTTMREAAKRLMEWCFTLDGAPTLMVNSKTRGIVQIDNRNEEFPIDRLVYVLHRGHFESDSDGSASIDYELFGFDRKDFSDFLIHKVGEPIDLFCNMPVTVLGAPIVGDIQAYLHTSFNELPADIVTRIEKDLKSVIVDSQLEILTSKERLARDAARGYSEMELWWSKSTAEERNHVAITFDKDLILQACYVEQEARMASPQYIAGWWEKSMSASVWWKNESITPMHAALILCKQDPNKNRGREAEMIAAAEETTGGGIGPDDFQALRNTFAGASIDKRRTLKDWMEYAQERDLKIHSWLGKWIEASGIMHATLATPSAPAGEQMTTAAEHSDFRQWKILLEVYNVINGLYPYQQAAREIADAENWTGSKLEELENRMISDINDGVLPRRCRKTGMVVGPNAPGLLTLVTPGDVNAWLETCGAPYRWTKKPEETSTPANGPITLADLKPLIDGMPKDIINPWLIPDPRDKEIPDFQSWFIPARYFARILILEDPKFLTRRNDLVKKISTHLEKLKIFKRGGTKPLAEGTIKKALINVIMP